MRRLGIDYGSKRVGLALTDEAGEFAYPLVVFPRDGKLLLRLKAICVNEVVGEIVLGESLNFRRRRNPIMRPILKFKAALEAATGLAVILEDELLTTKEASRGLGSLTGSADGSGHRDQLLDARAAAIILRNYLERRR
ncbi:MAG: Holliday junction resolvase RuvX [Candidatus Vogelbacteria bacterium]|nr:Holliday junction resolvase RuvX [Candidatus Vogelbacteria bacterium]